MNPDSKLLSRYAEANSNLASQLFLWAVLLSSFLWLSGSTPSFVQGLLLISTIYVPILLTSITLQGVMVLIVFLTNRSWKEITASSPVSWAILGLLIFAATYLSYALLYREFYYAMIAMF